MAEVWFVELFEKRVRPSLVVGQVGDPHLRERDDNLQLDRE